jgi:hypothetical protein
MFGLRKHLSAVERVHSIRNGKGLETWAASVSMGLNIDIVVVSIGNETAAWFRAETRCQHLESKRKPLSDRGWMGQENQAFGLSFHQGV